MLRPKVVLLSLASIAFALVIIVVVGLGKSFFQPKARAFAHTRLVAQPKRCKVLTVYDGDTLACDFNHNGKLEASTERVRLLSIDASEMSYSRKNTTGKNERMAVEAKQVLEAYLGHTLELRYDAKPLDTYGRHLVFAYPVLAQGQTSSTSLNEVLLVQGLARVWILPPNSAHQAKLLRLQNEAQQAKRGLWR